MLNNFNTVPEEEKLRSNYAEYLVKCTGKKTLFTKFSIVTGAGAVILLALFFVVPRVPVSLVPILLGVVAFSWYLWKFTHLEYEYIIISATVEFHRIYGESYRKKLVEIKTSDIEKVAPVCAHPEVMDADYAEIYDFSNGRHGEDFFYILYNGER